MNERIKLIAEQANLYARSDNSSMLFENYQKRYTEKFAELIIRECASKVDWIYSEKGKTADGFEYTVTQGDLIREHFGVEE
jgi:hypothetical protein